MTNEAIESHQEFVDQILDTSWFREKTLQQIILLSPNNDQDSCEPFNQLYARWKGGIHVTLSASELTALFSEFTIIQIFYILYGHWFGLSKMAVEFYSRKNWEPYVMERVVNTLTHYQIPEKEVFSAFKYGYTERRYRRLLCKYHANL